MTRQQQNQKFKNFMKFNSLAGIILAFSFTSCNNGDKPAEANTNKFKNKGHELVYTMVQKVGDYNKLLEKENVTYTYTYQTPDGQTDLSKEKYIFAGRYH